MFFSRKAALTTLALWAVAATALAGDGDLFTYQGELRQAGAPITDLCDLRFQMFDQPSGGNQVGFTIDFFNLPIVDGRINIDLDFGTGLFDGGGRWLEIAVRCPAGSGTFTMLSPRQRIMPTPYAHFALNADVPFQFNGTHAVHSGGNVGIGVLAPTHALEIDATTARGASITTSGDTGIFAASTATSGNAVGGLFETNSANGFGVHGRSNVEDGTGVFGSNSFAGGIGVLGVTNAGFGDTTGVLGRSASNSGAGVHGIASSSSGSPIGVHGEVIGSGAYAGFFEGGRNYFEGNVGLGVLAPQYPLEIATDAARGASITTSGTTGIFVESIATSGFTHGGIFESSASGGIGIEGRALAISGTAIGVRGESSSSAGVGVFGLGAGSGVRGRSETANGNGVLGENTSVQGQFSSGVHGKSASTNGRGVFGWATASTGTARGVYGLVSSPDGYAGYFDGGRNYFEGDVGIGTTDPEAKLHVRGDTPLGEAIITPSVADSSAQLRLTENTSASLGGILRYDGTVNEVQILGLNTSGVTSPHMIVGRDNGRVGIGTTSPSFLLEVNGSAGKPGGGSWTNSSDRRLKKDIEDLDDALDSLLALRGVTFEYIDPEAINELPGERIGMIAQEVEMIFPDWVEVGGHGYRTLTFRGFEALTVEALRELRAEKDAEITQLRDENQKLNARLERLEALVSRLAAEIED